ncbi:Swarming motility protein SwrC [compost metagenome]
MDQLVKFSMKNVSALFIIILLLFGSGYYAATNLKVELMPDISFPVVVVQTQYPGSPKDVMDDITAPIEEKLGNLEDLENISSTSSSNSSMIIIMFEQNVDVDKKKREIEGLVQEVTLPASSSDPKVLTFGASSMPTNYMVAYADNGMSQTELDKRFEDTIKPGLQSINGIDHIDVIGARDTSLDIELDADALEVYGLSPGQISNAISSAAATSPIGSVKLNGNDKMTRVTGSLQSLYDLEHLEITTSKGNVITLSDVAKVKAISESNFNARLDSKPAIGIILYKAGSANAVEFSDAITDMTNGWKTSMPNVAFKTTYDSSDEIKESINGLLREGVVGAILASLMILIFLRNVRMTLIVLVSLPLSILITLLLMWQFNLTLNTMTLGGMFIAIGRVVDDAIVVIENIYTSLEKAQKKNESVILLATKQVALAITASTLATVSVFAPMAVVSGIIGEIFRPFAITVAVALLSSLLVSVTVIPLLAKLMVLREGVIKPSKHEANKQGRFMTFYENTLRWSLTNRIKTLLIAGLIFVITLASTVPFLSVAFLPEGHASRTMYFHLKLPYETSFDAMDAKSKEIETALIDTKDTQGNKLFSFVEALVGFNDDDSQQTPYVTQIFVEVNESVNPDKVKEQVKAYILAELPQGSEVEPRSLGGGTGLSTADFEYYLKGEEQEQLVIAADKVKEALRAFPELSEIEDNLSDAKTEVEIAVDQKKARAYGLSAASIRDTARAWIQKQSLGDLKLDNETYATTVSLDIEDKNSLEKLGIIPLKSSTGATIYLKEVATISEIQSPNSLAREDQKQVVKVTAKINADNKNGVSKKVSLELDAMELPEGVSREVQGVTASINESFSQLFVAMAIAVCIVYLIMVLAFGNASAPFAILFSLPLAVIGGLLGLVIAREALSVTSLIGFMMLIGIVVTNAIVLIDRAQQLREEGYTVRHALLEAGKVRFRPIIMTAGATVMALVPLALGISGEGALIGKGLGVVVIGGLITSTILTLVVVPIIYEILEELKIKVSRLFKKDRKPTKHEVKPLDV